MAAHAAAGPGDGGPENPHQPQGLNSIRFPLTAAASGCGFHRGAVGGGRVRVHGGWCSGGGRCGGVGDPARIADSRSGLQIPTAVGALATVPVQVTGVGGIPGSGVAAVLVNVTLVWPWFAGYLTVWPSGASRPDTSNLNFDAAGQTVANTAIVPVGPDGKIQLFNGSLQVIVDITGYTLASA
jgi:hypothetical protein